MRDVNPAARPKAQRQPAPPKPKQQKPPAATAKKAATLGKQAKQAVRPSQLSPSGARFIARFEGFRSKMYDDAANHCTIGFGHLVHHGPTNGSESAEFKAGITRERALQLLQQDAKIAAAEVRKSVKVPISQPQFDALVSFAFNVGTGAFRESTLLRMLNEGRHAAVPNQLARWTKAGGRTLQGLVTRRVAEGRLFASGRYT